MNNDLLTVTLPQILYWGRGSSNYNSDHLHSFYQLEICIAGRFRVKLPESGEHIWLNPGECCLIAPETLHSFSSGTEECDFISVKFDFPRFEFKPRNDAVTAALCKKLAEALGEGAHLPLSDQSNQRLAQYLLYDLLLELAGPETPPPTPKLLHYIQEQILQFGYAVNVKILADKLGMSLAQLQYQYKLLNNSQYPNLKSYLDAQLINAADNHLCYSAMSISQIARLLNFPDVYTFSRFFKHRTGWTPTAYRKRQQ